ncbi:MAG: hypothetical protein ACK452_10000 [Bacteroidota bacterium]|jgi:DNA-binding NtrC family response regulator
MILPLILIIEKEQEVSELLKENLFFEGYDFIILNKTEALRKNIYRLLPEIIVVDERISSRILPAIKMYLSGISLQTKLLTYNAYNKRFADQELCITNASPEAQYSIEDLKDLVNRVVGLN